MTEIQTSNQNTVVMNVHVEGDKSGFNSKSALQKFKQAIKESSEYNLFELKRKFVKDDYLLEFVSKTETDVKFTVSSKNSFQPTPQSANSGQMNQSELSSKREALRARLEMLRKNRINVFTGKTKSSVNVPKDILDEYNKLRKVAKVPIPDPVDILQNPDQYRPMISMITGNSMIKKLGSNHPYTKYFKLLANKLNITGSVDNMMPNLNGPVDMGTNIDNLMKMSEPVTNVKGNTINDDDTDTEDEDDEKTIEV